VPLGESLRRLWINIIGRISSGVIRPIAVSCGGAPLEIVKQYIQSQDAPKASAPLSFTRISHKDLNDLPKMLMPLRLEIKYPFNGLS